LIRLKLIDQFDGLEKDLLNGHISKLSAFTSNTTSQLDVLGHDGDSLGVDGAQVGIFEQSNQVSFAGFLQGLEVLKS
jgi:hypothetical protein